MSATTDFWASRHISSNFGDDRGGGRKHRGTDYTHGNGTPIPSPLSGQVVGVLAPATWHGFGYQVTVRAASGETYSFAHMQSGSRFGVGSSVSVGDILGYEGRTGATTGPCVHVEYNSGGFSNPAPHVAALIAGGSVPAGSGGGGGGGGVKDGQALLNTVGYNLAVDGINGPATKAAVRDWQSKHGLVVDGVLGPLTAESIRAAAAPAPAPAPSGGGSLADVQRALKTKYPLYAGRLVVDGIDGPNTRAAVSEFQRRAGLTVDGIAGPQTRGALGL